MSEHDHEEYEPNGVDTEEIGYFEPKNESNSDFGTAAEEEANNLFDRGEDYVADTEEEEDEADLNYKPALEDKKEKDEDPDEEAKRKKKRLFVICLLCCFFILLIVIILVLFRDRLGTPARGTIDSTEAPTSTPTFFPTQLTEAPTLSPIEETQTTNAPVGGDTEFPTAAPTNFPTVANTFTPGDGITSRLPCEEIRIHPDVTEGNYGENNFKFYATEEGFSCGDTFGGIDPERPNRNQWSVRYGRRDCPVMNYDDGFAHCDSVGARWCSLEEFFSEVALGTGCGGDRGFVWTNTNCVENGVPGKEMFDLGLRDERQPFRRCETDFETLSIVRCCGDLYEQL